MANRELATRRSPPPAGWRCASTAKSPTTFLAPYSIGAFPGGMIPFSTLKIPEYMACARPVISVPSGHILRLIEDRRTGFLFANEIPSWAAFLKALPPGAQLAAMGTAAAEAVAPLSWERTASGYLDVARQVLAARA
jgi:glycosyltransferase involved in cell wall biosynthesis